MYTILVLTLLCILIAFLIWGRIERQWISLAMALILIFSGAITFNDAFRYVDWDVLGLILGVNLLTIYLGKCGFVNIITKHMVKIFGHSTYLMFFSLSMMSGLISMFMENVSVVILLFPIVYSISSSLGINPVAPTIIMTFSANLAGSATMIGDPPAIVTASSFGLTFTDFILYKGKPSMFFFTLISMIGATAISSYICSRRISLTSSTTNRTYLETKIDRIFLIESIAFLLVKIVLLSLRNILGIPLSLTAIIAVGGITTARLIHRDTSSIIYIFKHGFEWRLLLFLLGVFILSGSFEKHDVAYIFAEKIVYIFRDNCVALASLLLWMSVAFSAVIDNLPYTLTMIPVVKKVAEFVLIDPVIIVWSILIGTTLGGNLTYIGASANITAIRLLERNGHSVSFTEFIKIGIIYNTVSVILAWIIYIYAYFMI